MDAGRVVRHQMQLDVQQQTPVQHDRGDACAPSASGSTAHLKLPEKALNWLAISLKFGGAAGRYTLT